MPSKGQSVRLTGMFWKIQPIRRNFSVFSKAVPQHRGRAEPRSYLGAPQLCPGAVPCTGRSAAGSTGIAGSFGDTPKPSPATPQQSKPHPREQLIGCSAGMGSCSQHFCALSIAEVSGPEFQPSTWDPAPAHDGPRLHHPCLHPASPAPSRTSQEMLEMPRSARLSPCKCWVAANSQWGS